MIDQWKIRAEGIGEEVTIGTGGNSYSGKASEITGCGSLVIIDSNARKQQISLNNAFELGNNQE